MSSRAGEIGQRWDPRGHIWRRAAARGACARLVTEDPHTTDWYTRGVLDTASGILLALLTVAVFALVSECMSGCISISVCMSLCVCVCVMVMADEGTSALDEETQFQVCESVCHTL